MPRKKTSKKKDQIEITPEEILPSLFRSNMLRMILTKHIELNKTADTKANMLMTAASIVAAITISTGPETQNLGMNIILLSSLIAIIFAILAIIPKPYHKGSKCKNLLYFRDFIKMSEDEYVEAMTEMMTDKMAMYEQYIRDIYQYGAVTLHKKYRLLTIGLILFLAGLVVGGGLKLLPWL
ncbi:hypothetical protein JKY72_01280 [Candidatus Gracilibacteria bacterium]|nr:hypothetical protein [Candidatus Gracilibacteria bacterium]